MDGPEIAVVIPTHGRETRLAFALDALASQTIDPRRFEVVVVRDAEATEPLTTAPEGLTVRFLRLAREGGPTPKRNLGWCSTSAPLVAFTDDDCRPAPDWLEQLLAGNSGSRVIVQGRTVPDPDERHHLVAYARTVEIDSPSAWYETCNIAYPRSLLEHLGGFDERWDFLGDDTDLGLRATQDGAELRYAPDAVVWHAVFPRSFRAALRDAVHRSGTAEILRRYPAQRQHLYLRAFTSRNHPAFLLALGGIIVGRRRPILGALLVAPYLQRRIDPRRLRSPWGVLRMAMHLPPRVALDATEVIAHAAASLRHRTLVL